MKYFLSLLSLLIGFTSWGQISQKSYSKIESKVIEWRRDIHQNPELSNREFRTAEKVAKHLKSMHDNFDTWGGIYKKETSQRAQEVAPENCPPVPDKAPALGDNDLPF